MSVWNLVAFFLLLFAIWITLDLNKYIKQLQIEKADLNRRRERAKGHRTSRMEEQRIRRNALLRVTGMPLIGFTVLTAVSITVGFAVGKIMFQDLFLSCATACAFITVPSIYLQLQATKKQIYDAEKLENSLSIITNAYLSTGDIIRAVEDNIKLIEDKQPWEEFITDVTFLDNNVNRALIRMSAKLPNPFLIQWIDTLILSQEDRKMMYILPTIIQQMNDLRQDQMEAETMMVVIWRDYATLLLMICAIPVIFRIVLYEWYALLVTTMAGRGLILALIVAILYSLRKAMQINRPVMV